MCTNNTFKDIITDMIVKFCCRLSCGCLYFRVDLLKDELIKDIIYGETALLVFRNAYLLIGFIDLKNIFCLLVVSRDRVAFLK